MNEGDLRTNRGRSTRVIALLVILLALSLAYFFLIARRGETP